MLCYALILPEFAKLQIRIFSLINFVAFQWFEFVSFVSQGKNFVSPHRLSPFLHAQHLVSVFLPQLGVDALVDAHGVHGEGDGQEAVHLLVLLIDLKTSQAMKSFNPITLHQ